MTRNPRETDVSVLEAALSCRPVIQVMAYGPDKIEEIVVEDLDKIRSLKANTPIIWVNVDGPCDAAVLTQLGEIFQLHPLALEDVMHLQQRVKVEHYGEHYFVVCRMVWLGEEVESEQLSMFVGKGFVVTFQEKANGDCLDQVRERIRKRKGRIRELGADHLAYALIDAVVDGYFPVIDKLEVRSDELEDELEADPVHLPDPTLPSRIHDLRGNILTLRRTILPMRDAIHTFSRNAISLVSDETQFHLRDCYDHALRILELLETQREVCIGLRELYQTRVSNHLSLVGQHTNDVMKTLAIITTLFTPLTFIAGIYGMNFNPEKSPWNMPELNWFFGYPFALGLMAVIFVGLLFWLYKRGWLKRTPNLTRAARKKAKTK